MIAMVLRKKELAAADASTSCQHQRGPTGAMARVRVATAVAMLCCITCAAWNLGSLLSSARSQLAVARHIARLGGRVYDSSTKPPGRWFGDQHHSHAPRWVVERVGTAFFYDVRYIQLFRATVSPNDISAMGRLPDLRGLNLWGSKIESGGFRRLGDLKALRYLDLGQSNVTDDDLRQVSRLTRVTQLSLVCTNITDAGLRHLAPMIELESLDLSQVRGVSPEGVASLLRALPGLTIFGPRNALVKRRKTHERMETRQNHLEHSSDLNGT